MSNLSGGVSNEVRSVSFIDANNFKSTTKSRKELLGKLNKHEQKIFKRFVKSILGYF